MKGEQYTTGRASEPTLRYVPMPNGAIELHRVRESYFGYCTTAAQLAFTVANQQIDLTLQLLQVADFEVFYLLDTHTNAWNLQITDGSSMTTLWSQPVPAASVCGNGTLPGIVPVTFVFRKNGSIMIRGINGAVAANPGVLTIVGAHLYDEGPVTNAK